MSCVFPTPKEIPYQIKQRVMNHVFPKQWSLIKRTSLIKTLSVYSLFVSVVALFSWYYIRQSYSQSLINQPTIVSIQPTEVPKDLIVSDQDLYDIEIALSEAEALLNELENII